VLKSIFPDVDKNVEIVDKSNKFGCSALANALFQHVFSEPEYVARAHSY
jgi:hypothetical protein